jgi:16S rRNA U516 pseudouridylate synthase RsuA-like enzyme
VIEKLKKNAWVEIEIHEGRNREVRRIFEALGYFVEKLIRVRVGPVSLGFLPPGALRPLSPTEVTDLKRAVGLLAPPSARKDLAKGRGRKNRQWRRLQNSS